MANPRSRARVFLFCAAFLAALGTLAAFLGYLLPAGILGALSSAGALIGALSLPRDATSEAVEIPALPAAPPRPEIPAPVPPPVVTAPLVAPPPTLPGLSDARRRLRFASAISAAVPTKTEEAAFSLIEKFQALQQHSSKAAAAAKEVKTGLAGEGGATAVLETAERSRSAVKAERGSLVEMAAHNRQGAKELRAMGKEIESGIDLLKGIEEITERSRLIAFNMAVEAARIGEKGRGFKVIVGELRSLNDRTAEFSRKVAELLGHFRDYNSSLVGRLAEQTEKTLVEVEEGMDAAEGAVESLIAASSSADQFAREIAGLAEGIDRELDGVLESLQFQDITRQMIDTSLRILAEADASLEEAASATTGLGAAEERSLFEGLRRELLTRAKTPGEKEAIVGVQYEVSRRR